jgi:hypothetical protein
MCTGGSHIYEKSARFPRQKLMDVGHASSDLLVFRAAFAQGL